MERKKGLEAGAEQFSSFFAKGRELYYVDKTLFIKELIDTNFLDAFPKLVLRPRRFGKTLALSMLKAFFDIDEKDKAWMFEGLAISRYAELCSEHQNKYPVIAVNLKDLSANSYPEVLDLVNEKLGNEVRRHRAALFSDRTASGDMKAPLDRKTKARLDRLLNGEGEENDLVLSFKLLSQLLYEHYGVKPLVFIDEYDDALNSAYGKEYFPALLRLLGALFSNGFKGNEYLGGVLITGVLQITKNNIFSGMNNLTVSSVADSCCYSAAFGFTQEEVDDLLGYYGLLDRREDFRDWYDGYHIEECYVYNPYSIARAAQSCRIIHDKPCQNYWLNTAGNDLLKEMLDSSKRDSGLKVLFDALLRGESVETEYTTEVTFQEILKSRETITGTLLLSGYLTMDSERRLRVPNREVMSCFNSLAKEYNREYDESLLPGIIKAYVQKDPEEAGKLVTDYFRCILSPRDLMKSELVYHGFLCGALAAIKLTMRDSLGAWEVESNYQERLGYPDLVFWNLEEKKAIVIEEKAVSPSVRNAAALIEQSRDEGFAQIHDTEYADIEGLEVTAFVNVYHRHRAYVFMEQ